MKRGDLVLYYPPRPPDSKIVKKYVGFLLEKHDTWIKIWWLDNHKINEFNMGRPEFWEVISSHDETR